MTGSPTQGIIPETQGFQPMLFWCWASVADAGPTSNQHWFDALGYHAALIPSRKQQTLSQWWLNVGSVSWTIGRDWAMICLTMHVNCDALQEKPRRRWNNSGFRPPLCKYRLNWARRTSCGWWDDRDDTVLQTQDSKFEPWRSEADHATSRHGGSPQYWPTAQTYTWGSFNGGPSP